MSGACGVSRVDGFASPELEADVAHAMLSIASRGQPPICAAARGAGALAPPRAPAASEGPRDIVFAIFAPDGAHILASTSTHAAHLVRIADGSVARAFEGHEDWRQ